jgi:hypothetical protein
MLDLSVGQKQASRNESEAIELRYNYLDEEVDTIMAVADNIV